MEQPIEIIGPTWERSTELSIDVLRHRVLELPDEYWMQGNGQMLIRLPSQRVENELLVSPNKEFGISLKIFADGFDWLSLHDRSRLSEITTVSDDWLTSVGLFLPPAKAWVAIKEFCQSGERTSAVEWVKSTDMPTDSNW